MKKKKKDFFPISILYYMMKVNLRIFSVQQFIFRASSQNNLCPMVKSLGFNLTDWFLKSALCYKVQLIYYNCSCWVLKTHVIWLLILILSPKKPVIRSILFWDWRSLGKAFSFFFFCIFRDYWIVSIPFLEWLFISLAVHWIRESWHWLHFTETYFGLFFKNKNSLNWISSISVPTVTITSNT